MDRFIGARQNAVHIANPVVKYVTVLNPGSNDESVTNEFYSADEAYRFVASCKRMFDEDMDVMKCNVDGTLTTEF